MNHDPAFSALFHRTELLVGKENFEKLQQARVMIVGVGGVGSWCAESLVRSGIGHLTIVDSDVICVTNVNRQLQATTANVGASKVLELRRRFAEISPATEVIARQEIFNETNSDEFDFSNYDYVVDAIDSLSSKVHLIEKVASSKAILFASMGAASKLDSSQIRVAKMSKSAGCRLARRVRASLRDKGVPLDFLCVYSAEPARSTAGSPCGSIAHMTAIFGFTLAGLVVNSICGF